NGESWRPGVHERCALIARKAGVPHRVRRVFARYPATLLWSGQNSQTACRAAEVPKSFAASILIPSTEIHCADAPCRSLPASSCEGILSNAAWFAPRFSDGSGATARCARLHLAVGTVI